MKEQRGFALIEVMLAALVLVIGSAAFMRLQQIGLQQSFNNYARAEGTVIASNFSNYLRSNLGFVRFNVAKNGSIIGGREAAPAQLPQDNANCSADQASQSCSESTLAFHRYLISKKMEQTVPAGNSLLCYRESNAIDGYMRITYLWVDKNNKDEVLAANDCPGAFDTNLASALLPNSVTVYVQL